MESVAFTENEDPSLNCIFKSVAFNVVVESCTYNFLDPETELYLLVPLNWYVIAYVPFEREGTEKVASPFSLVRTYTFLLLKLK